MAASRHRVLMEKKSSAWKLMGYIRKNTSRRLQWQCKTKVFALSFVARSGGHSLCLHPPFFLFWKGSFKPLLLASAGNRAWGYRDAGLHSCLPQVELAPVSSSGPQDLLPFRPYNGRHHTSAQIHTFRSCSSSSIFGVACALTFSWGSSDSVSLSEGPSAASMLTAAGEKTRGEPVCHSAAHAPHTTLGSQSQGPLSYKKRLKLKAERVAAPVCQVVSILLEKTHNSVNGSCHNTSNEEEEQRRNAERQQPSDIVELLQLNYLLKRNIRQ